MRSYSTENRGMRATAREALHLVRGRADAAGNVAAAIARLEEVERLVLERLGLELTGLKMLDVGAGQYQTQIAYFARQNDVTGIDLDVIAAGFDLRGYLRMLRRNGVRRFAKTVARKLLLIDARYRGELARQLGAGVASIPRSRVLQMDAASMTFPDASFDFAYSFAVFQHLERPEVVLGEIARVLKPGGCLYLDFILFTSRTGSHDVRLLSDGGDRLPLWAHLRPQLQSLVQPNAYVNRIRLGEWRTMFERRLPGSQVVLRQPEVVRLEPEVRALWAFGELEDYELDELLTTKVVVLWRKPPVEWTLPDRSRAARGS